jgi:NAD(P)-dependent dehydrogenase (short-subunit alcohol dehydrogenase family)
VSVDHRPVLDLRGLGFEEGAVVVVTGAASGIGRATATLAARSGLAVVGWDLDADRLAELGDAITAEGGTCTGQVCDVTDERSVADAWGATAAIGVPRYLVNNAGPPNSAPLSYVDGLVQGAGSMAIVTETWLERHAEAAEAVTFTASTGALLGTQNWYGPSKAAIAGYARSVAARCGGRPRANTVAPGFTNTPRTAPWADLATSIGQRNPMGRVGEAEEIASVICFLLSPAASYVNGVLIPVDGGSLLTTG